MAYKLNHSHIGEDVWINHWSSSVSMYVYVCMSQVDGLRAVITF